MGHLLGHGVRFGLAGDVMAFGEGIETMLSLREVAPALPLVAGLSAAHLAALLFPAGLRRLYVAREDAPAGRAACAALTDRAWPPGISVHPLEPRRSDPPPDIHPLAPARPADNMRPQSTPAAPAGYIGRRRRTK